MRRLALPMVLAPVLLAGCATHSGKGTLADLHDKRPDLQDAQVNQGFEQAMAGYRRFLEETPETQMTPEAMRRLADLQVERQFGIRAGDGKPQALAAPEAGPAPAGAQADATASGAMVAAEDLRESDKDFERRTTSQSSVPAAGDAGPLSSSPMGDQAQPNGPLEAIALYERLLKQYPDYEHRDDVLYQMARAYDELGRTEEAMQIMERLIRANPNSPHSDEVHFRQGEYFFTRRQFRDAENAYTAIIGLGTGSPYYELGLYKLGWTFYKQDLYEEALQKYMALLDYKVSIGYDFDQQHDEDDDRRVADTFRVISLSFSNLGGPQAIGEHFSSFGSRPYEDRVYSNLGEHYLSKLRYDDAAKTYKAFVALYPLHRAAPHFSMRVIETFTQGGFPKLVLEAKRDFASTYGLQAEYWKHFKPEETPDVLAYLKGNLKDLATHYHAQYQSAEKEDEKTAHYREGLRWYGEYLQSFPTDAETPPIHYRLADLLLEHKDFAEAARQYERTAYDYPAHAQSAAAGYAAVYAYREELKAADATQHVAVAREMVASSIKFADAFPQHEKAAMVLEAAANDLYEMKDYGAAVATARRVIETYPAAEAPVRRSSWIVVAHGSFELAQYPDAEKAYTQVLAVTPEGDKARAGFVDNLAASIYKQGEAANAAQDYRAAADHFLRIRSAAPTSAIRPTAEYDAGAALVRLKDWPEAARVLDAFRSAYPDHTLHLEATRQIALAYRESGQLPRAAAEYERFSTESKDPAVRAEALLVAGDLYQQSNAPQRALDVYGRYVEEFPKPVETVLEIRFKIAEIHKAAHDDALYRRELTDIIRIDADAGPERTGRTRMFAGRASLVLADRVYQEFAEVKLRQPFEASLQEKKQRMDAAIETMDRLVVYEIAEVTAAATYYMAEIYFDFSRSLTESERPTDLKPAEMAEYEQALDESAFPFEEKAIQFHEKNLEMLRKGVFNAWIEKSLGRLAVMMPGRYAKPEVSSGFLGAIDGYVYRSPVPPPPPPGSAPGPAPDAPAPDGPAKETPPAPAAPSDKKVDHDAAP
jgi:tetratricopeptide (TPR) repeat protein